MSISVAPFNGAADEWNRLVASAAGGTHCHRQGWLGVVGEVFGHQTFALGARDPSGGLVGLLPLVRVRTALFGHYLVSMPFVNYGGPIGSSAAVDALVHEAVAMARAARVKLLELRSRVELPVGLPASHRKITVVLDLPATADGLWKALPAKLRSQVRRPQKEGIEVRFGPDQVAPFHRIFASHMRDLGTPALPRRFFEAMARHFGPDAWFACAYQGSTPVACGAGISWNGESEIIWASALRDYNRLAPNMLLYWAAMERAIADGCGTFNFGRCTPGSGTHRFKQQWGGRDEQLWWYQDSPSGLGATPSPDGGGYGLAVKLWRRLPLSVTTSLGPWLVRGIP